MKRSLTLLGFIAASWGNGLHGQAVAGDSAGGERVLRDRGCIGCHKVDGKGGARAPDLGRRTARDYTPSYVAAVVWNHAPAAWARLEREGVGTVASADNQAADLFAYFSARKYFERPGDAARGKRVFVARHCAECHGISGRRREGASPAVAWRSLGDRVAFAFEVWNHHQEMGGAFNRQGIRYSRITSAELTDLMQYLEILPETRSKKPQFQLASVGAGRGLFQTKGCAGCHRGRLSLEGRPQRLTMTDVAAAMWNHPLVKRRAELSLSLAELREICAYLWSLETRCDPRRGRRIFAAKNCVACHDDIPAPNGRAETSTAAPVSMTALAWTHGPSMMTEMRRRGLAWPRFTSAQLAHLGAFLETIPRDARFHRGHAAAGESNSSGAAGVEKISRLEEYR